MVRMTELLYLYNFYIFIHKQCTDNVKKKLRFIGKWHKHSKKIQSKKNEKGIEMN